VCSPELLEHSKAHTLRFPSLRRTHLYWNLAYNISHDKCYLSANHAMANETTCKLVTKKHNKSFRDVGVRT
jgi:hypothetical protein